MHRHIDQLLFESKEAEAIPLIEAVWAKEEAKRRNKIANLARKIEALEKRKEATSQRSKAE